MASMFLAGYTAVVGTLLVYNRSIRMYGLCDAGDSLPGIREYLKFVRSERESYASHVLSRPIPFGKKRGRERIWLGLFQNCLGGSRSGIHATPMLNPPDHRRFRLPSERPNHF